MRKKELKSVRNPRRKRKQSEVRERPWGPDFRVLRQDQCGLRPPR